MIKTLFIPRSLDINVLLNSKPPAISNFSMEKLLVVLDFISEASFKDDDTVSPEGYGRLYSKILQSNVHDYKKYLSYLSNNLVIEIDNQYIVGEKCRGYKYSDKYFSELVEVEINTKGYKDKWSSKKLSLDERRSLWEHQYITKWLYDITIDYYGAKSYLQSLKMKNNAKDLKIYKSYNSGIMSITKIHKEKLYSHIDNTSHRLHTNLTNLGSNLRKFIRYKGKPLVSFDIKNSQFYFAVVLLNSTFYKSNNKININKLKLKSINKVEINAIARDATIMLEKAIQMPNNLDKQLFTSLVSAGQFYDYLLIKSNELSIRHLSDRAKIKNEVFLLIFSKDKLWRTRPSSFKSLFNELFPSVYELFRIIKKKHHNSLAILLQRIESYMVIDVICKEISKINPEIPLFTIHDSIATTEEYSELVNPQMKEKLTSFIGVPPTLKMEKWA